MSLFNFAPARNIALALGLALGFQSCLELPEPQKHPDQEKSSASFILSEIKGESEIISRNSSFKVPEKRLFNFNACLTDRARKKDLRAGLEFAILIDKQNIPVQTKEGGCIAWSEALSYNYLADAKYITLERKLVSKNSHRGSIDFEIALNPWLHGGVGTAVLDPRFHDVPNRIEPQESQIVLSGIDPLTKAPLEHRSLFIPEADLIISEKNLNSKGIELSVEIKMDPLIRLYDVEGRLVTQDIWSGDFRVQAHIISVMESKGKEERTQLSVAGAPTKASMIDGKLITSLDLLLPYVPTRGQLQMWLSVDPVNGPVGLKGFSGIYHLGAYHDLKGSARASIKPMSMKTDQISLTSYVHKNAAVDLTPTSPYFTEARYVFEPLQIRFVQYGKETATTREVVFTAYTCMKNAADGKPAKAYNLTIKKTPPGQSTKQKVADVRTLDNGCFQWSDTITHTYFARERLIINTVTIENQELDISEDIGLAINPWDFGFTFGRDTRLMSEADLTDKSYLEKPKSEFYINGFRYTTIGVDFAIDSLMNLRLYRRVMFRIDPLVLRYHSMTMGRNGIEYLRDGVYLIKLALQRNGYEDPQAANEYISSVEKLVQVRNNQIITPVEFAVDDVRLLGSRNNLLIELATVDEQLVRILPSGEVESLSPVASLDNLIDRNSGLDPKTFIGPIILYHEDDGKAVLTTENQSLLDLLAETTSRSDDEHHEAEEEARTEVAKDDTEEHGVSPTTITATELIRKGKAKEAIKKERAKAYATLDNFLFENDLLLVDPKASEEQQHPVVHALTSAEPLYKFKHVMNDDSHKLPKQDYRPIISDGEMTETQMLSLCDFWFNEHMPSLIPNRDNLLKRSTERMITDCQHRVVQKKEEVFVIEKRLHIDEIGPHRYLKGFAVNYNFGTGFGLSRNQGTSVSRSWSGGGDFGLKVPALVGIGPSASAGWKINRSTDQGTSSSVKVDMSAATFLITEMNNFEVTLNKYRRCVAIRMNPNMFAGEKAPWRDIWGSSVTLPEKAFTVTAGYYMCEDELVTEPTKIFERFYYLSQHFNTGHLQDKRDLRNRQFLLALRGPRDYSLFMDTIEARPQTPEASTSDGFDGQWPLETIYPSFQMQKYSPAFPGTYLVLPPDMLSK